MTVRIDDKVTVRTDDWMTVGTGDWMTVTTLLGMLGLHYRWKEALPLDVKAFKAQNSAGKRKRWHSIVAGALRTRFHLVCWGVWEMLCTG